jgi:hypothetical protein
MQKGRLIILLLVVWTVQVSAQDSTRVQEGFQTPKSWFRLGVGGTRTLIFIGGGVFFRLNDPLAIGVRGGVTLERELFRQPSEALWEFSPSLAYVPLVGSGGMITLLVGAGLTGGTKRGEFLGRRALVGEEYEKVTFQSPSATAEVQATWFVTKGLGLSAVVFTNVNKERSFTGYQIGAQFTQP